MMAEASQEMSSVRQSRAALLAEPIPWKDRQLTSENLKTLLLARLPETPTARDVETLFGQLGLTNAGRQGDMVQALVPARPWYWPLRGFWSITALVNADDRVVSFRVQGHSGL